MHNESPRPHSEKTLKSEENGRGKHWPRPL